MFFYELSLPNRWIIQRCLQSGTIYSGRSSRWSLRSVKAVSPGCKQRVQSVNRGTKSLKNAKNWRRNKFTCWFDPVLEYLWLSNYFESAESSFSFFFFFFLFFFISSHRTRMPLEASSVVRYRCYRCYRRDFTTCKEGTRFSRIFALTWRSLPESTSASACGNPATVILGR